MTATDRPVPNALMAPQRVRLIRELPTGVAETRLLTQRIGDGQHLLDVVVADVFRWLKGWLLFS